MAEGTPPLGGRSDYAQRVLSEGDLHADPLTQFQRWVDAAIAANAVLGLTEPMMNGIGGSGDFTTRVVAEEMSRNLGIAVLAENRPGAGATIASDVVAKAAPDGYTLLMVASGPIVINPVLYSKVPYDPIRDLQPISQVLTYQYALVTPAKSPWFKVDDLIAQARQQPGKLSYGSAGVGAGGHLAGEMLASMTGTQLAHVPYKGNTPAVTAVVAGEVDAVPAEDGEFGFA